MLSLSPDGSDDINIVCGDCFSKLCETQFHSYDSDRPADYLVLYKCTSGSNGVGNYCDVRFKRVWPLWWVKKDAAERHYPKIMQQYQTA
jgi:hypothetical protein